MRTNNIILSISLLFLVIPKEALSAPQNLVCINNTFPTAPPIKMELDESKNIATVGMEGTQISSGALDAAFDDNTVEFDWKRIPDPDDLAMAILGTIYQHYTLDRTTLDLVITSTPDKKSGKKEDDQSITDSKCRLKDGDFLQKDKEKAGNDLQLCYLHSIANNELGPMAFANCIKDGIIYCNVRNLGITKNVTVSPITGSIILDNDGNCADNLSGIYAQSVPLFQNEYDNYSRSESLGIEYKPVFFDIRKLQ